MALDLSAIAKGYAVDLAVAKLRSMGFKSAIVNAGGDIYCLGKKNFLRSFWVQIKSLTEFLNGFQHGQHIFQGDIGLDIMHGVENKSSVLAENLALP